MSIILCLAATTRRGDRGSPVAGWRAGVVRISGIDQVRISGTRMAEPRQRSCINAPPAPADGATGRTTAMPACRDPPRRAAVVVAQDAAEAFTTGNRGRRIGVLVRPTA